MESAVVLSSLPERSALVTRARIGLIAAGAFLILLGIIVYSRPSGFVEIGRFDLETAADMKAAFIEEGMVEGTDFRIEIDGYNAIVEVDAKKRSEAALLLAGKGLGGTREKGFTIFEGFDSTAADLEQRIKEIEGLKSELRRMIRAYKEVEDVQISLPLIERSQPDTAFEIPQTAGVVLTLRPEQKLTDDQITAVRYLIAGVFPGLNLSPRTSHSPTKPAAPWSQGTLRSSSQVPATPPPRDSYEAAGPVSRSPSEATIASMQPAEMPRKVPCASVSTRRGEAN